MEAFLAANWSLSKRPLPAKSCAINGATFCNMIVAASGRQVNSSHCHQFDLFRTPFVALIIIILLFRDVKDRIKINGNYQ